MVKSKLMGAVPTLTRVAVADQSCGEYLRWMHVACRASRDVQGVLWNHLPPHATRRRPRCSSVALDHMRAFIYDAEAEASSSGGESMETAVREGNLRRVKEMLQMPPVPGFTYCTELLHMASACNRVDVLNLLMQTQRFRVDMIDSEGMTPLHRACECGAEQAAVVLLEWGAGVNKVEENGREGTALTLAASRANDKGVTAPQYKKLISVLCAAEADEWASLVYLGDRFTALRLAARSGRTCMVGAILQCGCICLTVGWCSPRGETALQDAVTMESSTSVKLLLESGASVYGITAKGHTHRVKALIRSAGKIT